MRAPVAVTLRPFKLRVFVTEALQGIPDIVFCFVNVDYSRASQARCLVGHESHIFILGLCKPGV